MRVPRQEILAENRLRLLVFIDCGGEAFLEEALRFHLVIIEIISNLVNQRG